LPCIAWLFDMLSEFSSHLERILGLSIVHRIVASSRHKQSLAMILLVIVFFITSCTSSES
jgi:hypothetical protein